MAETIMMPQLGESVVEGTIAQWLVKVGDRVEAGQSLVEVETDKANTEVPAQNAGYVEALLVPEGETVNVGTPIITLSQSAPSAAASAPAPAAAEPAKQPQQQKPAADAPPAPVQAQRPPIAAPAFAAPANNHRGPAQNDGQRQAVVGGNTGQPGGLTAAASSSPAIASGGHAPAAPAATQAPARQAAPQTSNDGAGPYGAPVGARYFKPPVIRANPEDTVIRFSKRRGIISEHMVYSKHVSPHVPCVAEVDMTAVMESRRAKKAELAEQGVNLTVFAYLLAATAQALREFPNVNAVAGSGEVIQRGRIHLGIAVETEGGLLVPVIRDADSLSVGGMAKAVSDLATKARDKRITVDDLSGGTFTVSNPGRKGNLFGAAVINQPQVGILRMGEIVRRPVVRTFNGEEAIVIRSMMYLSLSYDHRIIDGVEGNGFLYRVGELLESGNFDI